MRPDNESISFFNRNAEQSETANRAHENDIVIQKIQTPSNFVS